MTLICFRHCPGLTPNRRLNVCLKNLTGGVMEERFKPMSIRPLYWRRSPEIGSQRFCGPEEAAEES